MHGNVLEWCGDWDSDYPEETVVDDPLGADVGSDRVSRGGSWDYSAGYCRSAFRLRFVPSARFIILGFRVALGPSASKEVHSGAESGGGAVAGEDIGCSECGAISSRGPGRSPGRA